MGPVELIVSRCLVLQRNLVIGKALKFRQSSPNWKVAKPVVFALGMYLLRNDCPSNLLTPLWAAWLLIRATPRLSLEWLQTGFCLTLRKKVITVLLYWDDRKSRACWKCAVAGPWLCAFNQKCLLSSKASPSKETIVLHQKLDGDKQAIDESCPHEKVALGQNGEIDTFSLQLPLLLLEVSLKVL